MQNILSLNSFKQQLEEHDSMALLVYDSENESSRSAFRHLTETTYLGERPPVFVVDVNEVSDIQSKYQLAEIPSLLFFVKGKVVQEINGFNESNYLKALRNHEFIRS
jgi:thiol-disulfide isomerase/thioredoxin